MSKHLLVILFICGIVVQQCRVTRELIRSEDPAPVGLDGMKQVCMSLDTIESILISKAEAIIMYNGERYEVTVTIFSKKDSIIYLSAVNSGFEILRASVEPDTIRVIDRLNKTVYRTPLNRRFGYQNPVNFNDLQNIFSRYYLCNDLSLATDDQLDKLIFEFNDDFIKKRIYFDRQALEMRRFEFYHSKTEEYLMGERKGEELKINSNFMINEFEISAGKGTVVYNQNMKVKMHVNPRRYSFIEL